MAVNAQLIELGEGTLVLKGTGESAAVDVGGTMGGEFSYVPSFKDIEVGQSFAPVKTVITGVEGKIKVTLGESSMRNIAIACGLKPSDAVSSSASDVIEFGSASSPAYFAGMYTTPQIDNTAKNYVYIFYKMQAVSGLVVKHAKGEERTFEVEFKLFANDATSQALANGIYTGSPIGASTIGALGRIIRER